MPKVFYTEEVIEEERSPYEAVVLASKESRRLNRIRLQADIPEGEEKITTLALNRLTDKKIRLTYDPDETDQVEGENGNTEREKDSSGS